MSGVTSGSSAARNPPGSTRPSRARALLLVVIREFVWPTGQHAWSSTLSEDRRSTGMQA